MRVNASKTFFSKTFMYGLKVLLQRQFTKSNKKKSGEVYLNLNCKDTKLTLLKIAALKFLAEIAIFAILLLKLLLIITLVRVVLLLLNEFIKIFNSHKVFSRLTFLMNDLRLKTFYCKSINSRKFIENTTTPSSTTPASVTTLNLSTSSKSNHLHNYHRTYKNNSKSLFLNYTPPRRDPRLRIFLKTKHFFNRPQQQKQKQHYQLNKNKNIICCTTGANRNLLRIFSELCNYGELIGGGECNSGENKIFNKQLNGVSLNSTQIIRNNLRKTSDNTIATTASAAIDEQISNDIFIVIIIIVAVISEYTKELFRSFVILLSFHYNRTHLKILEPTFDLSKCIV